jgi:hypothetical protein
VSPGSDPQATAIAARTTITPNEAARAIRPPSTSVAGTEQGRCHIGTHEMA